MNATAIADIRRNVEPGALPKRVRLYAWRRELERVPPAKAIAVGFAAGVWVTSTVAILIQLLSR